MLPLFLIGIIAAICFANIRRNLWQAGNGNGFYPEEPFLQGISAGSEFAVDFSLPSPNITAKVLRCLRKSGYTIVFLPVYYVHKTHWIPDAVSNIHQAIKAGLGVEVYMMLNYHLFKEGSVQMIDVFHGFNSTNLGIRRIWVKVKSGESVDGSWENNRALLKQIMSAARKFDIDVGFFTNRKNWNELTNKWELEGHPLWYWNVRDGPRGETPPNFEDFRPFGGWTEPTVKQFAKNEKLCGATINWDVYDGYRLNHHETQKF